MIPAIWSEPLDLGFSVFPCVHPTKRPAVEWNVYRTARAPDAQIMVWGFSQYNVATATGPLSGVWVLDTDSPAAEAALLALGSLPDTLTASTPRGRHRYFRWVPGVGNRARLLGHGIDVRGEGGYVLSPGSVYEPTPAELAEGKRAGSYQWETAPDAATIADAPDWLIAMVTRSNEPVSYGELATPAIATITSDYGRRALTAETNILRAAQPGERNEQLNRSAFAIAQLVAGGDIVVEEAAQALREAAGAIGLEPAEIEQTLESGWKAGARQPRKGVTVNPAEAFGASAPVLPAGASAEPLAAPVRDDRVLARGATIFADQMDGIFRGCVFIRSMGRIWTPKDGEFRDKLGFDTEFGGYTFTTGGERNKPTDSAWDSFRLHKSWDTPQAESICFRPDIKGGSIIREEGRDLLNIFLPIETRRIEGDPTPFLEFLNRLLPTENDRQIILAYMASLIQNPGKKFQWWPVIQGTEGNGKSLLSKCIQHAVGKRYTHLPNAPDLARNGLKFNGWVTGNLYCAVEEISLGNKRDFLEEFKPIVTNDRVPIERKGVDQITGDNRLNGMLMTNHQDGVPITVDTRRYAVFYTAQQSKGDKIRDGMTGAYFADLYDWLSGEGEHASLGWHGGYAIVAHYLAHYDIPVALDPARLCTEAPRTSSFGAAVRASLGRVEQEVLECVDQGLPGYCGGWVSSLFVDRLILLMKANVPRAKRKDMMRVLGYIPHPALKDGRVNNPVRPDGGKPRLYLLPDHPALALTDPAEVAKAYMRAQDEAVTEGVVLNFPSGTRAG